MTNYYIESQPIPFIFLVWIIIISFNIDLPSIFYTIANSTSVKRFQFQQSSLQKKNINALHVGCMQTQPIFFLQMLHWRRIVRPHFAFSGFKANSCLWVSGTLTEESLVIIERLVGEIRLHPWDGEGSLNVGTKLNDGIKSCGAYMFALLLIKSKAILSENSTTVIVCNFVFLDWSLVRREASVTVIQITVVAILNHGQWVTQYFSKLSADWRMWLCLSILFERPK